MILFDFVFGGVVRSCCFKLFPAFLICFSRFWEVFTWFQVVFFVFGCFVSFQGRFSFLALRSVVLRCFKIVFGDLKMFNVFCRF